MGAVRKWTGLDLTGGGARDAADNSARLAEGARREGLATLRADLEPFRGVGSEAANMLLASVFNPQAQDPNAILNNPFYKAQANELQNQLLNQRSALGLGGSGGTQDALMRNLLLLGRDFQQQDMSSQLAQNQTRFNQLFNISTMGQNAAAQTGTATLNTMSDIGDIRGVPGQVAARVAAQQGQQFMQAAGPSLQSGVQSLMGGLGSAVNPILGAGGAILGGIGSGISSGVGALAGMFSDRRMKRDIVKVGEDKHGNIYRFRYLTDDAVFEGRMADELAKIRPDAVITGDDGYMRVVPEFYPVEVA